MTLVDMLMFRDTQNLLGSLASFVLWIYIILLSVYIPMVIGVELGWWSL